MVLTDASGANRVYVSAERQFESWDGVSTVKDRAGREWKLGEDALTGPGGAKLKRLPAHRAFWFGWYAAFPATRLVKYAGQAHVHGAMVRAELKHRKQLPSAYLQRFTYDTIGHDDAINRNLVRQVKADRVPLGSDNCFDMRQEEPVHTVERLSEVIGEGLTRMGRIIGEANIKVE